MHHYSPFDKTFANISAEDLHILTGVTEGWYIEYKREVPKSDAIAKSISAFANTYGGWLFYGINEKSKEDPTAGSFSGIKKDDLDPSLQRIRQAVATFINPAVHFDLRVLWGPSPEIALPEDCGVICIHVPWSSNAPHVHRGGHIYRRVSDGSEPKPESDRFILDQLWKRSEKISDEYEKWVKKPIKFSDKEKDTPFLRLLITADLWGDKNVFADISIEQFRKVVGDIKGPVPATPFDTAHTFAAGFVARQLSGNDPANLGLTFKFWSDLTSEILIPLPFYTTTADELWDMLEGYSYRDKFIQIIKKHNCTSVRVIDLNLLLYTLTGIFRINTSLCDIAAWDNALFAKVRMTSIWRTIPFLDVPHTLECMETHGLPMCLDEEVFVAPGTDPYSFIEIPTYSDPEQADAKAYLKAMRLFIPIAEAFGIPGWHHEENIDEDRSFMSELIAAGSRAINAQRLRNSKHRRSIGSP